VNKFLKLVGTKQGPIKGPVTQPGKEDSINVISFSLEISGDATGRITPKPLIIVKSIDRTTPQLYQALVNHENLSTFNLAFYVKTSSGQEVLQFKIDLVNAVITSIIQAKENSNSTPDLMKFAEYEEVYFSFQKITWSWTNGPEATHDFGQ
jgi:type VI secretion system secreted protein Hcp